MTRRISLFLVLVLSIITFGAIGTNQVKAETKTETTTFVLHKLLFDLDKLPDEIINDGYENSAYEDYQTLNGAEFEVYDVTNDLLTLISGGHSIQEAQSELSEMDISDRTPLKTGVTEGDGVVTFNLPSYKGRNTAYLFHESKVPEGVKERATNLVVVLPYHNENGVRLSKIHLYPKNESEDIPFKKVIDGDVSYDIGEKITYEITTKVPMNPQDYDFFRIRDLADEVLLFDDESLIVSIGDENIDDVYMLQSYVNGFLLTFDLAALQEFRGQEIKVNYEMSLSNDAIPDVNYFNKASVEYDNHIKTDQDVVRTGGYHFIKVDLRDEKRALADAHFILRNDKGSYLTTKNGTNAWIENKDNAIRFVSGEDGSFKVMGLKYGRYFLEEVKAPEKYVLSNTSIPFEIMNGTFSPRATMNIVNKPVQPGKLPITGGKEEPQPPAQPSRPTLPITRGEERPRLPRTGEINNMILSVVGIMLIISSLVILNTKNERRGNNK